MSGGLLSGRCWTRSLSLLMRGLRWRTRGSVVLWRSLTRRRIVCRPCLLLRLRRRTRWRSATLCLVRLRNIVWLRRRGWMLLHNLLVRCVIRRMRYVIVIVRLRSLLVRSVIWLRYCSRAIVSRQLRNRLRIVRTRDVVVGPGLLITVLRRITIIGLRRAVYCR